MIREIWFRFFKSEKCTHPKITPQNKLQFCPDCGKPVILFWKIVRCDICNTKRSGLFSLDSLVPTEKYCSKCGSDGYYVETKEKLPFYEIDYAVLVKEELDLPESYNKTQIWIDLENRWNYVQPKLLPFLGKVGC